MKIESNFIMKIKLRYRKYYIYMFNNNNIFTEILQVRSGESRMYANLNRKTVSWERSSQNSYIDVYIYSNK